MKTLSIILLSLMLIAVIAACKPADPAAARLPTLETQPRCKLTYSGYPHTYTLQLGEAGRIEGGVLVDGECSGVTQQLIDDPPPGLEFSNSHGGRRWQIAGVPTEAVSETYTIRAQGRYGTDRTVMTHRIIAINIQ